MLNANFILSMVRGCVNSGNQIGEDDFLDLVDGLEEQEVEEVLDVLASNNICVVEEKTEVAPICEYHDYRKYQKLTNEQLCIMHQKGDKAALEALLENNKRLVMKIASRVFNDFRPDCLERDDVICAGYYGMIKAANKFEISMGNKFTTYACWWVKQSATREVMEHGYGIKLPVHIFEKIYKVNKIRKMLVNATVEDIVNKLNETSDKQYDVETVEELIMYSERYLNTASLNKAVGNDSDATELADFIPDKTSVEDEVMARVVSEELEKVLAGLSERENKVIHMRFGIGYSEPMTLEEVGSVFNVTRERIRQIEAKALKKLSSYANKKRLESLYVA